MNRQVNLTKRIKTDQGSRFCPAVFAANQRVRPDYVIVDENEERHPEGSYYIDWYQGTKRVRKSVGKDAAQALARQRRQEQILRNKTLGIRIVDEDGQGIRRPITDAIVDYLGEIKISLTPATYSAYNLALRNFTDSCSKTYLEEVDRADLLRYVDYLRNTEKLSDRTCHNRFEHVVTFLKAQKISGLATKRDWPKYVQQEPESYEDEELEKFFAACTFEERVFFEFYLKTGFRKKEVTYTLWDDINLRQGVVRVTAKPDYGFRPKDWEEREVPIPDELVDLLKKWAKNRNGSFVFPTRNGTPRKHRTQLLELCKEVAHRAKLNPKNFFLHKFRATFATNHLRRGVDLRTVQLWLGHRDLKSTARYLKPARGKGVRKMVNNTWRKEE